MVKAVTLTQAGFDSLKQEYDQLKNIERPQAVKAVEEARSLGDLRENAAYHAARNKQSFIQGRMDELEQILKSAQVEDNPQVNPNEVQIGSVVHLEVDGMTKEITIVNEHEADIKESKISANSPLGNGLLGKALHASVKIDTPSGTQEYKITYIH